MSETEKKRKNFTEREKAMLLKIVENHVNIIENKCTNAITIQKKQDTWTTIMKEYNACAVPRNVKQLNTLYLNLKRTTRKNVADENMQKYIKKLKKEETADKKGISATGGGSYRPLLTDAGAQMLALIGDQVQPLSNDCDSAADYFINEAAVVDEIEDERIDEKENCSKPPLQSIQNQPYNNNNPQQKNIQLKNKKRKVIVSANNIKKKFYQKKYECAVVEKKIKILEYKLSLKRQSILDLELKIKKQEYERLFKDV